MKWLFRALVLIVALLVACAAGVYWLLRTESGLKFALANSGAQVLGYASASGSLADGAVIEKLDARWGDVAVRAERVTLRLVPSRLLHREVVIDALTARGLIVAPQASDAPPSPSRPGKLDLPVAIVLRNLDLTDSGIDTGGETPLQFSLGAREISLRDGQLAIDGIALRAGELLLRLSGAADSRQSWASTLDSEGELPVGDKAQRARVGVKGNLDALDVDAQVNDGQITLKANIADVLGTGATDGRLNALGIDPREFGLDAGIESLDLDVQFGWRDGRASVTGGATVNRQPLEIELIDIGVGDGQVQIGEAKVGSAALGYVSAKGSWPLDESAAAGALTLDFANAALADWRAPIVEASRLTAQGAFSGRLNDWQLALDGSLFYDRQTLPLRARIAGNDATIALEELSLLQQALQIAPDAQTPTLAPVSPPAVTTPAPTDNSPALAPSDTENAPPGIIVPGSLSLTGTLDRATLELATTLTASRWQLDAFAPEWPGQLSGTIDSHLVLAEPLTWRVATTDLSGTLRGSSIALSGELGGSAAVPQTGTMAIVWGEGRTQLEALGNSRLRATLDNVPLIHITRLTGGRLSGSAEIDLAAADVIDTLTGELRGSEIAFDAYGIASVELSKSAGWNGKLAAQNLILNGRAVRALDATLTGSASAHQLTVILAAQNLDVSFGASGAFENEAWRGVVDALDLSVARLPTFSLQAPTSAVLDAASVRVEPLCLAAGAARACVGIERGADTQLSVDLASMPLSLAQPLLPGDTFELAGLLSGGGSLGIASDTSLSGQLKFTVENGTLKGASEFEAPIDFQATAALDAAARRVEARLTLAEDGFIEATVSDLMLDSASLTATLKINDLALAETVTPEVQSIRGALSGTLSVPLNQPQLLAGRLRAERLAFELPSVGLKVTQGAIDGTIADNVLALEGDLNIAPGTLKLSGQIALDGTASELRLVANNAGLVDLPAVRLAGDTDLIIKLDGDGAAVQGGVLLRAGRIDLDRFAPPVAPSEDVVIVDAPPPPAPLPLRAEVSVAFIQEVDLRGYGLLATLGGGVRISQVPGKKARGTGEMTVKGTYQAYGQRLDIERGRLRFTGGFADNPALDILAAKSIQRQRVGVEVRGRARRPLIQIYSDPQLDQSEALSYLVLGRPITTASSDDSARLGEYADALQSAGGSLIAGSIGQRLGLAAGIESLGSSIGSALVVGKYVSPRFFIGYGSSLIDAIQLVILRYRVTENIEIEGISGNEQKASVSWRMER